MSGFHGLPAGWRYIKCPLCGAKPFEQCFVYAEPFGASSARKSYPHTDRERAAEEAIAKGNETIFNEENVK